MAIRVVRYYLGRFSENVEDYTVENKAANWMPEYVTARTGVMTALICPSYQPADDALVHYLGCMACGWSIVWGIAGVFEDKESESRARISGFQGEMQTV